MSKKSSGPEKYYIHVGLYTRLLVQLTGHYISTAAVFLALVFVTWSVSFAIAYLHSIHPLSDELMKYFIILELYVGYVDSLLCAFVFLIGAYRFVMKGLETDHEK